MGGMSLCFVFCIKANMGDVKLGASVENGDVVNQMGVVKVGLHGKEKKTVVVQAVTELVAQVMASQ